MTATSQLTDTPRTDATLAEFDRSYSNGRLNAYEYSVNVLDVMIEHARTLERELTILRAHAAQGMPDEPSEIALLGKVETKYIDALRARITALERDLGIAIFAGPVKQEWVKGEGA